MEASAVGRLKGAHAAWATCTSRKFSLAAFSARALYTGKAVTVIFQAPFEAIYRGAIAVVPVVATLGLILIAKRFRVFASGQLKDALQLIKDVYLAVMGLYNPNYGMQTAPTTSPGPIQDRTAPTTHPQTPVRSPERPTTASPATHPHTPQRPLARPVADNPVNTPPAVPTTTPIAQFNPSEFSTEDLFDYADLFVTFGRSVRDLEEEYELIGKPFFADPKPFSEQVILYSTWLKKYQNEMPKVLNNLLAKPFIESQPREYLLNAERLAQLDADINRTDSFPLDHERMQLLVAFGRRIRSESYNSWNGRAAPEEIAPSIDTTCPLREQAHKFSKWLCQADHITQYKHVNLRLKFTYKRTLTDDVLAKVPVIRGFFRNGFPEDAARRLAAINA